MKLPQANIVLPEFDIVELEPRLVAYVRHQGYGRSIKRAWQLLMAWGRSEERFQHSLQIGLSHFNPVYVPLAECRYVACLSIDKPILRRDAVSSYTIPGGTHAVLNLRGEYGEMLPLCFPVSLA